jgi:hypothetical protein
MTGWLIVKSGAIAPLSAAACDAAYRVRVASGSSTREVVVEFVAPSSVVSVGYAEEVVRRFLPEPEPPQHLLVALDGQVRVLRGPPDTPANQQARPASRTRQPQRARPHRRTS